MFLISRVAVAVSVGAAVGGALPAASVPAAPDGVPGAAEAPAVAGEGVVGAGAVDLGGEVAALVEDAGAGVQGRGVLVVAVVDLGEGFEGGGCGEAHEGGEDEDGELQGGDG